MALAKGFDSRTIRINEPITQLQVSKVNRRWTGVWKHREKSAQSLSEKTTGSLYPTKGYKEFGLRTPRVAITQYSYIRWLSAFIICIEEIFHEGEIKKNVSRLPQKPQLTKSNNIYRRPQNIRHRPPTTKHEAKNPHRTIARESDQFSGSNHLWNNRWSLRKAIMTGNDKAMSFIEGASVHRPRIPSVRTRGRMYQILRGEMPRSTPGSNRTNNTSSLSFLHYERDNLLDQQGYQRSIVLPPRIQGWVRAWIQFGPQLCDQSEDFQLHNLQRGTEE